LELRKARRRIAVALLIGVQFYNAFTRRLVRHRPFAYNALAAYLGSTALAALTDRARKPA
jgi:hypothetical protein